MRLVSLASLLFRVVPLVTANEAAVGVRSCVYDSVLRALRLDQDQSIPFCRDFLTTIIIVSVTVTITDSTKVTETIRPTYTDLSTKIKTATFFSALPDNNELLIRILAARDQIEDYSSSLISQYSSVLSSACSCLCVDPIGIAGTATTTTQTIPETIVNTSTEFETVEGPTTTIHATTTTTTTVVAPPPSDFPSGYFRLGFFVGDGSEYEKNYLAFPTSGPRQDVFQAVNPLDSVGTVCKIDTDHHLSGPASTGDIFAWYPGAQLDPSSPYEVPFSRSESISLPLEYLEWTADPKTFSLILLTDQSFNVMQLCPSVDSGLQIWAVGAVLGTDISCTEIPLAVEPLLSFEYLFLIYYRDAEGTKQYLAQANPGSQNETQPLFLTSRPDSFQSPFFQISYNHLTFVDNGFPVYSYFNDIFQGGDGWSLTAFSTPAYVKFFSGDAASYYEWAIDWEAYTIHPVIPKLDTLIMQLCVANEGNTRIWAIGTTLRNDEAYTCTAVTLELEFFPNVYPNEDFRIGSWTEGGDELYLRPLYEVQPGDEHVYFILDSKRQLLASDLFSYDADGHLSFYSSYLSTTLYAWSPNYPESSGWWDYMAFNSPTDIGDSSYYFEFSPAVPVLGAFPIPSKPDILLGLCHWVYPEGDYIDLWSASATLDESNCTYPPFFIRPKTWPFRLSWITPEGHKQYFKTVNIANPDSTEIVSNLNLVATPNITESPIFTIDADRHLWYDLDWPDGPFRMFSTLMLGQFDQQVYPFDLFFSRASDISGGIDYLEWVIENNVLLLAAAPTYRVMQLCPFQEFAPPAWAVWTSVFYDEDPSYSCIGIELKVEWQLESSLYP